LIIKNKILVLLVFSVIVLNFRSTRIRAQKAVKIWEEPLTLPTYLVDPPNPNPMFYTGRAYQGAEGHIYPYPLLDDLTEMDFFAKFGEKQSQDNRRAAALYQLGLAYMGKGARQEAQFYFEKALRFNPYHLWAQWFTDH